MIFGAKNKSLMKNDLKSGIIISPNLLPFSSLNSPILLTVPYFNEVLLVTIWLTTELVSISPLFCMLGSTEGSSTDVLSYGSMNPTFNVVVYLAIVIPSNASKYHLPSDIPQGVN